mmetsp:Transcript_2958/g.4099  ORF Transcript_2958/g.4099 Transcript_2958/m.4099 type:complete len:3757 (+) Transcript_2958:6168-17438(+)
MRLRETEDPYFEDRRMQGYPMTRTMDFENLRGSGIRLRLSASAANRAALRNSGRAVAAVHLTFLESFENPLLQRPGSLVVWAKTGKGDSTVSFNVDGGWVPVYQNSNLHQSWTLLGDSGLALVRAEAGSEEAFSRWNALKWGFSAEFGATTIASEEYLLTFDTVSARLDGQDAVALHGIELEMRTLQAVADGTVEANSQGVNWSNRQILQTQQVQDEYREEYDGAAATAVHPLTQFASDLQFYRVSADKNVRRADGSALQEQDLLFAQAHALNQPKAPRTVDMGSGTMDSQVQVWNAESELLETGNLQGSFIEFERDAEAQFSQDVASKNVRLNTVANAELDPVSASPETSDFAGRKSSRFRLIPEEEGGGGGETYLAELNLQYRDLQNSSLVQLQTRQYLRTALRDGREKLVSSVSVPFGHLGSSSAVPRAADFLLLLRRAGQGFSFFEARCSDQQSRVEEEVRDNSRAVAQFLSSVELPTYDAATWNPETGQGLHENKSALATDIQYMGIDGIWQGVTWPAWQLAGAAAGEDLTDPLAISAPGYVWSSSATDTLYTRYRAKLDSFYRTSFSPDSDGKFWRVNDNGPVRVFHPETLTKEMLKSGEFKLFFELAEDVYQQDPDVHGYSSLAPGSRFVLGLRCPINVAQLLQLGVSPFQGQLKFELETPALASEIVIVPRTQTNRVAVFQKRVQSYLKETRESELLASHFLLPHEFAPDQALPDQLFDHSVGYRGRESGFWSWHFMHIQSANTDRLELDRLFEGDQTPYTPYVKSGWDLTRKFAEAAGYRWIDASGAQGLVERWQAFVAAAGNRILGDGTLELLRIYVPTRLDALRSTNAGHEYGQTWVSHGPGAPGQNRRFSDWWIGLPATPAEWYDSNPDTLEVTRPFPEGYPVDLTPNASWGDSWETLEKTLGFLPGEQMWTKSMSDHMRDDAYGLDPPGLKPDHTGWQTTNYTERYGQFFVPNGTHFPVYFEVMRDGNPAELEMQAFMCKLAPEESLIVGNGPASLDIEKVNWLYFSRQSFAASVQCSVPKKVSDLLLNRAPPQPATRILSGNLMEWLPLLSGGEGGATDPDVDQPYQIARLAIDPPAASNSDPQTFREYIDSVYQDLANSRWEGGPLFAAGLAQLKRELEVDVRRKYFRMFSLDNIYFNLSKIGWQKDTQLNGSLQIKASIQPGRTVNAGQAVELDVEKQLGKLEAVRARLLYKVESLYTQLADAESKGETLNPSAVATTLTTGPMEERKPGEYASHRYFWDLVFSEYDLSGTLSSAQTDKDAKATEMNSAYATWQAKIANDASQTEIDAAYSVYVTKTNAYNEAVTKTNDWQARYNFAVSNSHQYANVLPLGNQAELTTLSAYLNLFSEAFALLNFWYAKPEGSGYNERVLSVSAAEDLISDTVNGFTVGYFDLKTGGVASTTFAKSLDALGAGNQENLDFWRVETFARGRFGAQGYMVRGLLLDYPEEEYGFFKVENGNDAFHTHLPQLCGQDLEVETVLPHAVPLSTVTLSFPATEEVGETTATVSTLLNYGVNYAMDLYTQARQGFASVGFLDVSWADQNDIEAPEGADVSGNVVYDPENEVGVSGENPMTAGYKALQFPWDCGYLSQYPDPDLEPFSRFTAVTSPFSDLSGSGSDGSGGVTTFNVLLVWCEADDPLREPVLGPLATSDPPRPRKSSLPATVSLYGTPLLDPDADYSVIPEPPIETICRDRPLHFGPGRTTAFYPFRTGELAVVILTEAESQRARNLYQLSVEFTSGTSDGDEKTLVSDVRLLQASDSVLANLGYRRTGDASPNVSSSSLSVPYDASQSLGGVTPYFRSLGLGQKGGTTVSDLVAVDLSREVGRLAGVSAQAEDFVDLFWDPDASGNGPLRSVSAVFKSAGVRVHFGWRPSWEQDRETDQEHLPSGLNFTMDAQNSASSNVGSVSRLFLRDLTKWSNDGFAKEAFLFEEGSFDPTDGLADGSLVEVDGLLHDDYREYAKVDVARKFNSLSLPVTGVPGLTEMLFYLIRPADVTRILFDIEGEVSGTGFPTMFAYAEVLHLASAPSVEAADADPSVELPNKDFELRAEDSSLGMRWVRLRHSADSFPGWMSKTYSFDLDSGKFVDSARRTVPVTPLAPFSSDVLRGPWFQFELEAPVWPTAAHLSFQELLYGLPQGVAVLGRIDQSEGGEEGGGEFAPVLHFWDVLGYKELEYSFDGEEDASGNLQDFRFDAGLNFAHRIELRPRPRGSYPHSSAADAKYSVFRFVFPGVDVDVDTDFVPPAEMGGICVESVSIVSEDSAFVDLGTVVSDRQGVAQFKDFEAVARAPFRADKGLQGTGAGVLRVTLESPGDLVGFDSTFAISGAGGGGGGEEDGEKTFEGYPEVPGGAPFSAAILGSSAHRSYEQFSVSTAHKLQQASSKSQRQQWTMLQPAQELLFERKGDFFQAQLTVPAVADLASFRCVFPGNVTQDRSALSLLLPRLSWQHSQTAAGDEESQQDTETQALETSVAVREFQESGRGVEELERNLAQLQSFPVTGFESGTDPFTFAQVTPAHFGPLFQPDHKPGASAAISVCAGRFKNPSAMQQRLLRQGQQRKQRNSTGGAQEETGFFKTGIDVALSFVPELTARFGTLPSHPSAFSSSSGSGSGTGVLQLGADRFASIPGSAFASARSSALQGSGIEAAVLSTSAVPAHLDRADILRSLDAHAVQLGKNPVRSFLVLETRNATDRPDLVYVLYNPEGVLDLVLSPTDRTSSEPWVVPALGQGTFQYDVPRFPLDLVFSGYRNPSSNAQNLPLVVSGSGVESSRSALLETDLSLNSLVSSAVQSNSAFGALVQPQAGSGPLEFAFGVLGEPWTAWDSAVTSVTSVPPTPADLSAGADVPPALLVGSAHGLVSLVRFDPTVDVQGTGQPAWTTVNVFDVQSGVAWYENHADVSGATYDRVNFCQELAVAGDGQTFAVTNHLFSDAEDESVAVFVEVFSAVAPFARVCPPIHVGRGLVSLRGYRIDPGDGTRTPEFAPFLQETDLSPGFGVHLNADGTCLLVHSAVSANGGHVRVFEIDAAGGGSSVLRSEILGSSVGSAGGGVTGLGRSVAVDAAFSRLFVLSSEGCHVFKRSETASPADAFTPADSSLLSPTFACPALSLLPNPGIPNRPLRVETNAAGTYLSLVYRSTPQDFLVLDASLPQEAATVWRGTETTAEIRTRLLLDPGQWGKAEGAQGPLLDYLYAKVVEMYDRWFHPWASDGKYYYVVRETFQAWFPLTASGATAGMAAESFPTSFKLQVLVQELSYDAPRADPTDPPLAVSPMTSVEIQCPFDWPKLKFALDAGLSTQYFRDQVLDLQVGAESEGAIKEAALKPCATKILVETGTTDIVAGQALVTPADLVNYLSTEGNEFSPLQDLVELTGNALDSAYAEILEFWLQQFHPWNDPEAATAEDKAARFLYPERVGFRAFWPTNLTSFDSPGTFDFVVFVPEKLYTRHVLRSGVGGTQNPEVSGFSRTRFLRFSHLVSAASPIGRRPLLATDTAWYTSKFFQDSESSSEEQLYLSAQEGTANLLQLQPSESSSATLEVNPFSGVGQKGPSTELPVGSGRFDWEFQVAGAGRYRCVVGCETYANFFHDATATDTRHVVLATPDSLKYTQREIDRVLRSKETIELTFELKTGTSVDAVRLHFADGVPSPPRFRFSVQTQQAGLAVFQDRLFASEVDCEGVRKATELIRLAPLEGAEAALLSVAVRIVLRSAEGLRLRRVELFSKLSGGAESQESLLELSNFPVTSSFVF